MNKIFLFILGMMICIGANAQENSKQAAKEAKKAAREAKKMAEKAAADSLKTIEFDAAVQAIKSNNFVLEADKVEFKRGTPSFVNPNTNFVMMSEGVVSVQLAPTNSSIGANGLGGVTVDGTASSIKIVTNAKGNVIESFMVLGRRISAQVIITLTAGSNRCEAKISGNFGPDVVYFTGKLIPKEESNVFKGRSL